MVILLVLPIILIYSIQCQILFYHPLNRGLTRQTQADTNNNCPFGDKV